MADPLPLKGDYFFMKSYKYKCIYCNKEYYAESKLKRACFACKTERKRAYNRLRQRKINKHA